MCVALIFERLLSSMRLKRWK